MKMPNPNVARARNNPESRIAGIATMAPTGTATRPPMSTAIPQGTPLDTACAKAAAPTAASDI